MKIVVYGLGIIGASLAAALRRAGHFVLGKNRGSEAIGYSLEHGYIDGATASYEGADVVFLALPPRVTARELDCGDFPAGCIVADVCGVKKAMEDVVLSRPRSYRYVGIHPMAGKETSGVRSASADLFVGANLVLVRSAVSDEAALGTVRTLSREIGFSRIVECTAERHDRAIALTSQLAHVLSNAYVKSQLARSCEGFTGGSFQDLARVAGVDENMWTQLYFLNRDPLLAELDRMIARLGEYRDALERGDEERMRALLREGRAFRDELASFFS